jgi:hypothetical protein
MNSTSDISSSRSSAAKSVGGVTPVRDARLAQRLGEAHEVLQLEDAGLWRQLQTSRSSVRSTFRVQ